jgi:6-pyruvoyltetrahydropterin/6-carboxytetrahydropterin synthase
MKDYYWSTIELQKEDMCFTAGHTTIFSATKRENLHGHHYTVQAAFTTKIFHNGITFDYRYYKGLMISLCKCLHQTFLMPAFSPYLQYKEDDSYHYFTFNAKTMVFLKEDVTILPVTNITIEELSRWFIQELAQDTKSLDAHHIEQIVIKVFSAPGQSASHTWQRT